MITELKIVYTLLTAKQRPNYYMQCNSNFPTHYILQFNNTVTSSIILPATKHFNRAVYLTIRLGVRVSYDQIINDT